MATQQPSTGSGTAVVEGAPGAVASGGGHGGGSTTPTGQHHHGHGGYKRTSRKGAPRRFACEHAGCDKIYSRAEHLQRHQLNHNPREIYQCHVYGCDKKFVRADLLVRHKKRHSSSYIPRNRLPSFSAAGVGPAVGSPTSASAAVSPTAGVQPHPTFCQTASRGPYDACTLLTPDSNTAPTPTTIRPNPGPSRIPPQQQQQQQGSWPAPMDGMQGVSIIRQKPGYYTPPPMPEATTVIPYSSVPVESDDAIPAQDNFTVWLFDPQRSFSELSVSNIPFLHSCLDRGEVGVAAGE